MAVDLIVVLLGGGGLEEERAFIFVRAEEHGDVVLLAFSEDLADVFGKEVAVDDGTAAALMMSAAGRARRPGAPETWPGIELD